MTAPFPTHEERAEHHATGLDWTKVASLPPTERLAQLRDFYTELAALPDATRLARLRDVVAVTYALPDEPFRALTEARLRAWLTLDQAAAARAAQSYDAVLREVSAGDAMRRVAVVQTLLREFSAEEQRRLRQLNPEERARGQTLLELDQYAEPAPGTETDARP